MQDTRFDILGIGNAIVDVVSPADHNYLSKHSMHPGSMALIDADRAQTLYDTMPRGAESSGGSVANSCAVAAALGAQVAYIGKVAHDTLGQTFAADMKSIGVHFPTAPLQGGAPTARCLILVTPDGQRTMNTFLGASVALGEHDIDKTLIAESAILYLEGYLFDPPAAQAAFRTAARAARHAGRKVALSLSDAFCVDRHRAAFRDLLADVDLLFANEVEITSLFETNSLDDAIEAARALIPLAAITPRRRRQHHRARRRNPEHRRRHHQGRRHHRCRRRLRSRLPRRLHPQPPSLRLRPPRQPRRRRSHFALWGEATKRPYRVALNKPLNTAARIDLPQARLLGL